MKSFLQTLFFFFLATQICFSQWYQQNSGTTVNLNSVHFEDTNIGWTVGASGTILHTTNGGQEWLTQASGMSNNLNEVWFTDLNTAWVVGDSGKILKTITGGQEWIEQTSGTNFHLTSVCFTDMNKGWVVGEGIILHTNDGGTVWVEQSNDTLQPGLNSVCFVDGSTGWASGYGTLIKTNDGGENWINPVPGWYWSFINSVHFFDLYKGWVSVAADISVTYQILYTINGGIDWFDAGYVNLVNSIYFIDANNGWLVGGISKTSAYTIYKSFDGGLSWISQPNVTGQTLNSVYFTDLNNGWAVGENGTILHTTNGGVPVELTSFTATTNGKEVILNWSTATEINNQGFSIERKSATAEYSEIGFVPGFGTITEPKSYSYTDSKVSSGKYTYHIKQIDFDGSYEYSSEVEVEVSASLEFSLEQNFPNPFNPTTTINYSIPEMSKVMLKLFNLLGEEVATLVNEEKVAGSYEVEFNAANLPSGVYFYQLRAGDFIETKKMVLMK